MGTFRPRNVIFIIIFFFFIFICRGGNIYSVNVVDRGRVSLKHFKYAISLVSSPKGPRISRCVEMDKKTNPTNILDIKLQHKMAVLQIFTLSGDFHVHAKHPLYRALLKIGIECAAFDHEVKPTWSRWFEQLISEKEVLLCKAAALKRKEIKNMVYIVN
ncbi:hypothetical protein EDC94DRAFT_598614, partial [Helicostylum pulchrum]